MRREKLFIDTGGWIALIDSGDRFHKQAKAFYLSLDPSVQRVSSSHVIGETYTWLRYKVGFPVASKFLFIIRQAKLNDRLTIIHDSADLLERTEQLLDDYQDQKLSYVDASSMATMRNEAITKVFGFDHHFYIMKFEVLPQTD
jgi:predicted nucleic acid-binding protein